MEGVVAHGREGSTKRKRDELRAAQKGGLSDVADEGHGDISYTGVAERLLPNLPCPSCVSRRQVGVGLGGMAPVWRKDFTRCSRLSRHLRASKQ